MRRRDRGRRSRREKLEREVAGVALIDGGVPARALGERDASTPIPEFIGTVAMDEDVIRFDVHVSDASFVARSEGGGDVAQTSKRSRSDMRAPSAAST